MPEDRLLWAPLLEGSHSAKAALALLQGPLVEGPALPEAQALGPAQALVGADEGHSVAALRWAELGGEGLVLVAHVNRGEAGLALRLALAAAEALAAPEGA